MKQIRMIVKSLGTICEIDVDLSDKTESSIRSVLSSVKDYLLDLDNRLSVFRPDSEISKLNCSDPHQIITLSPDTFAILKEAKRYAADTKGLFDVTIGKYTDFWRKNKVQTESTNKEPLHKTNAEGLLLDDAHFTAQLTSSSLSIDLGGIAKGYAVDRTREMLLSGGIHTALLNFGGTVSVIGQETSIGIRNPLLPMNRTGIDLPFCSILCKDEVIVTSGIYEQSVGKEQQSHHIIDPGTGLPSKTDLLSATVISKSGTSADVYATAFIVLGLKKSLSLAKAKNLSVIFVDRDRKVYVSNSLQKRFQLKKEIPA